MSTRSQRPTWFGFKGEPIPSNPLPDARGQLAVVDPASGDDELWICLRSASGTLRYIQLVSAGDLDGYVPAPPYVYALPGRGVMGIVVADGNAATFSTTGMSAPVVSTDGSATSSTTPTSGARVQLSTSGVINSNSSLVFAKPGDAVRSGWDFWFSGYIEASSTITSIRDWVGFFDSSPAGSDDPAIEGFGFRFSTGSSDVNWMAWSNDGTSTGTKTNSGVVVSGSNSYRLSAAARGDGTAIDFWINDVLIATHTTNLPVTTTYLGGGVYCRALSASQRAIRINRFSFGYGG